MIAPAVRLILGAFDALGGLIQVALTLWDVWSRSRDRHLTPSGAAETVWSRKQREDLVWGLLCLLAGVGLVFGPSVTGYVFLLATPLALLMLVWRHRKPRARRTAQGQDQDQDSQD